ncbi:glycosyltransferase involved in cell wall biosynthesis [Isoptericola jiangsuensis]|uniref:Glycosyltransferase involved in cell wall biosynthesis n=1 Tax=Isoptericola jiangsuensis TaxID=548579 RepID=A0A2A9F1D4_9MICO|nr:glycosyltransferase [Isoptericola jiangsuensis]PFG44229.1 glycosyltransferase involved in cell wall biosynthesis [Isoptericola jiangsuensis]
MSVTGPATGRDAGQDHLAPALVVFSLEPWDDVWRRNQHLVSRLLAADPALHVLFVEPPADPLHRTRTGGTPRPGAGTRRGPRGPWGDRLHLHQPTKWLPRRVDPAGDARRARGALRAARRLGLRPVALWVNDLACATVLDDGDAPVLYDVTDDWTLADRPARERDRLVAAEERLLRDAAAVVVCSPALVATKTRGDRVPALVTNGVDGAAYRAAVARPAGLPAGPVALYAGTLHRDRLDVDVTVRTQRAVAADGGTVVLLGPDALGPGDRAALEAAGVLLLGPRPFDQVPAFLRHADVLLVPHVVDGFTDSLDPIKGYEYRAAGRPVVATPVAGFRDADDPAVRCVPAAGFPAAVGERLADVAAGRAPAPDGSPAELPADLPTWDRQAALVEQVLSATTPGRPGSATTDAPRRTATP